MEANKTATPWYRVGNFIVSKDGAGPVPAIPVCELSAGDDQQENAEFILRARNEFKARGIAMQAMTAKAEHLQGINDELVKALQAFMATDPAFCRVCDSVIDSMAADGNLLAKVVKQARAALTKAGA